MRRHLPTRGGCCRRKIWRVEVNGWLAGVGFSLEVDRGTVNLMVGSPARVKVVV